MRKRLAISLLALVMLASACSKTSDSPAGDSAIQPSAAIAQDSSAESATPTEAVSNNVVKGMTLEQLIPEQYGIMGGEEQGVSLGDLNGDGIDDVAVVLEALTAGEDEAPGRALLLALGAGDGLYHESAVNEAIVYRADEGGVHGDPFGGHWIDEGNVVLQHYGGSNWRWSNSYRIGWRDGGWYGVGYTSSSEHIDLPEMEYIDYDVSSGTITLQSIDDTGKEVFRTKHIEPEQFVMFEELTPSTFDFVHPDPLTYESEALGFSIHFPDSWIDYYHVEEDDEALYVYFKGKSEISRADAFGGLGLYLFTIGPEGHLEEYNEMLDNVTELGTASNGATYYYYTATDCTVCMLYFTDDLEGDEDEAALRKFDQISYEVMNEDLEQLLNSFKVLQ